MENFGFGHGSKCREIGKSYGENDGYSNKVSI
jgi:hypothetical protein